MPVLHAELESSGKDTAGFVVPDAFVDQLGGGRHPKVRVRLNGTEFATSIAAMGGRFLLGVSAERRQAPWTPSPRRAPSSTHCPSRSGSGTSCRSPAPSSPRPRPAAWPAR